MYYQQIRNRRIRRYVQISLKQWFLTGVVPPRGEWRNFQGSASPHVLYNMESFWTGMCTFQTLRQCEFYVATGLVPAEMDVGVMFLEIFQAEFEPPSQERN